MSNEINSDSFNTMEVVYDALVDLLQVKRLDAITVKELCEHAGISRVTYYRHFSCLDDVITSHLSIQPIGFDPELKPEDFDPYKCSYDSFAYFYKERRMIQSLIGTEHERIIRDFCYDYFHNGFKPIAVYMGFTEPYDLSALTGMYLYTILDWVGNDCDISVEEMAKFGELIFRRSSYGKKEEKLKSVLSDILGVNVSETNLLDL